MPGFLARWIWGLSLIGIGLSACSTTSKTVPEFDIQTGAVQQTTQPAYPQTLGSPTLPDIREKETSTLTIPTLLVTEDITNSMETELSHSPTATPTQTSTPTLTPTSTLTPCTEDVCIEDGHFIFSRPIDTTGVDYVDPTYRYGSTQEGKREPHFGVEFLNRYGTPVRAAETGRVVVAGDDSRERFAPLYNFYGNLVVIQHNLKGFDQPIFTLYAHLSKIQVNVGDMVDRNQQIGLVGYTGAAEGSHLHFEVRIGSTSYKNTRNPELWLENRQDPSGDEFGVIAGKIHNKVGVFFYVPDIVISQLLSPESSDIVVRFYVESYADEILNKDDDFNESFAIGDLQPGWYKIRFVTRGLQERIVQVFPGKLTLVDFYLPSP